jgi:hypothetical protein
MIQNFRVDKLAGQRAYNTQYGQMVAFVVDITGDDQTHYEQVEISQKPTTPPITEAQILYGDVLQTQYGMKFKKEMKQEGQPTTPATTPAPQAPPANETPQTLSTQDLKDAQIARSVAIKHYDGTDIDWEELKDIEKYVLTGEVLKNELDEALEDEEEDKKKQNEPF